MTTTGPLEIGRKAGGAWLLVLAWTAVLWWLGGDTGSLATTSRFLLPLLRWLLPDADPQTLYSIHFFLRKGAHVGGYGLLGSLTLLALLASTRAALPRLVGLALAWVVAIAACDEVRQSFSAMRTGSAWDVGLDVSGGLLALALTIACTRGLQVRHAAPERR